ncbi:neprilysin-2-like isoform X2 [Coccinella septempunctata]|uniref:neprilysin-2-like isoform X2 n=1 Tax=Coccinella septempunctata TaxID=41139 RepID=UPI001D068813|nr:neprilysin-2-like isoform X2 [Coccinella septempunctata]
MSFGCVKRSRVFWENRSELEKKLLLFVLFLSIVLLVVILFIVFVDRDDTCLTMNCVSASTHILDYVDFSVRPCENFYNFVCGSFLNKASEYNKKPAIKNIEERTRSQIESLITSNTDDTATNSLKLQRQFYRSCINTTAIEEDENDTFLTLIDSIGGWPVIKNNFWDEKNFDWKQTMIMSRKLGLSFQKLIGLSISYSDENTTILEITPPDDVDHINAETMEPYVELIRDVAILLHAPSLGINSDLRHVVHFQNELYSIISKARSSKASSKEMTVKQLQDKYPRISWLQFLNAVLSDALVLKESDTISLRSERYLIDLEILLLNTKKSTQANYIIWKTIEKFVPFLTEEIRSRFTRFQRQFLDKKTNGHTRKEECVKLAKEMFTNVAEIEYARRYTDPDTRKVVKNIFEKVKDALIRRLKASTRLEAHFGEDIEKEMRNMEIHIGGTDMIFDKEKVEDALGYNDLIFLNDDLVKIVTKVSMNRVSYFFGKIGKQDETFAPYTDVNAYYSSWRNALILSVPLLHDIFYDKNRPNFMNYGALVSGIGHEFAHSLEKLGNQTEETKGRFVFIYNEAFSTAFGNYSRCFEEEYRRYHNETHQKFGTPPEISNSTLEENIADFVGTDIAHELYQDYVHQNGVEKNLPGIDLTPNQIFWVMTGTFLCGMPSSEKPLFLHANSEYRINYRLRNLPQFARDFHCPSGSFMNPEEKCKLY